MNWLIREENVYNIVNAPCASLNKKEGHLATVLEVDEKKYLIYHITGSLLSAGLKKFLCLLLLIDSTRKKGLCVLV